MIVSQIANLKSQNNNLNRKSSDINVRTYFFSLEIIQLINQLPGKRVFWVIGDQLLRCGTSIGANCIEAKASSSRRDFVKFYEIALKSANETQYWLCLLRDAFPQYQTQCETLLQEAVEISKMLGSSVLTLKNKRVY